MFYNLDINDSNNNKNKIKANYGICGVTFTMITLCVVDHVFEPRSGQTKDYEIGIYCFSAKHEGLRRNSKDCLAWIMCLSERYVYLQTVVSVS